jgi:hypothetical protein
VGSLIMPQPLRQWVPTDFSNEVLTNRPDLAVGIARVSAAWTYLETEIGLLVAIALDTEARVGVAMYLALTGSAAQDRVLAAMVQLKLTEPMQVEFLDFLSEIRTRASERNNIVHALWGVSDKLPDALINCPPDNLIRDVTNEYVLNLALNVPS